MTVSELKNKILIKGWSFRFLSPNPLKKNDFGWKTLEDVEREHGGFEAYLRKIAESQKLKEITIDARAKNGNSNIKVKDAPFFIPIEPVEEIATLNNNSIASINKEENIKTQPVIKIEKTETQQPTPTKMEDIKTHIENASMKTELQFLKADNDRLKESNKKLEQKNDELYGEVSKLGRELSTLEAKKALEYDKKEIELLNKQKSSLGGIVEDLKSLDPVTVALGISMFQPNNPAVKAVLAGKGMNTNGVPEANVLDGTKHENSDTQDYIVNHIYPLLVGAESGVVGMIGGLVDYFIKHPEHLVVTYQKWFPDVIKDGKTTAGTTDGTGNDDDDDDDENN